jgi:hypothetical protein
MADVGALLTRSVLNIYKPICLEAYSMVLAVRTVETIGVEPAWWNLLDNIPRVLQEFP